MSRVRVAGVDDIPLGSMQSVKVGNRLICLAHLTAGGFCAINDVCTHEGELLSDGYLSGNEVECPAHGSRFNLSTGAVSGLPATLATHVHEVTVEDDGIYIED